MSYPKKQILIAICLNIGQIIAGCTMGWPAPILLKLGDPMLTPLSKIISVTESSWVASCLKIGFTAGCFIAGCISDNFGRKPSLIFGGFAVATGHAILMMLSNLIILYIGILIAGIGVGAIIITEIIYSGEIASVKLRGKILASAGTFFAFGFLIIYSIAPFVSIVKTEIVLLTITGSFIVGCFFLPESPIYYATKGHEEDMSRTLQYLERQEDIKTMKDYLETKRSETLTTDWKWKELVLNKCNRRSFIINFVTFFNQQCCGVVVLSMFATVLFKSAGSSIEPNIATIIVGATQLVGSLIVPFLVEYSGRKPLLLVSSFGCVMSTTMLGAHFYLDVIKHPIIESIRWLPLASLMLLVFAAGLGLNVIPSTILGEVYCSNVRSVGSNIIMFIRNVIGFASITSFGYMIVAFGYHIVFWIYGMINVIGFILILVVVPETKGKSLTEIEYMLSKK